MVNKWAVAVATVAVVGILITTNSGNKENAVEPLPKPTDAMHLKAQSEEEQKLTILQKDVHGTEQLILTEIKKDLHQLTAVQNDKSVLQAMQKLQQEHPHMIYMRWEKNDANIQFGDIPHATDMSSKSYLEQAKKIHKDQNEYISEAYYGPHNEQYRILSFFNNDIKVTAVAKLAILPAVEQHQRQNLRLIPYPPEDQYKIEAVTPNTTISTEVTTGEDNAHASHYHQQEVVVKFSEQLNEQQISQIKQDISSVSMNILGNTYIFKSKTMSTIELIAYFHEHWPIEFIEPHYLYMTNEEPTSYEVIPNDALFERYQWNIPNIEAEKGWILSKGSEDVIIAVLDTGAQLNHPDLEGRFTEGTNITDPSSSPLDDLGHGTHVAGIIGATANNEEGIAGISWYNKIMPVKVLNSNGAGSSYSVAQGIIWATDHGAKVINMSLGNYASADFLHEAIKYAYDHDVVIIAASGNDNTNRPGYPAAYPEVFAVGATTSTKQRATFSNYGDYIDVAAPGDSIASTYIGGQYAALSGTSMATPHVSALAGLIRSINTELTNVEVMDIMRQSANDLGEAGKDPYFGYGEIDVLKALSTAASYGGTLQSYPQTMKKKLERIIREK